MSAEYDAILAKVREMLEEGKSLEISEISNDVDDSDGIGLSSVLESAGVNDSDSLEARRCLQYVKIGGERVCVLWG